jgi:aminocarboxymuconate-semialdehyde decarboxylase
MHVHMIAPSMVKAARDGSTLFGVKFGIVNGRLSSKYGNDERLQGYADFAAGLATRLEYMDLEGIDRQIISLSPGSHRNEMDPSDAIPLTRLYNDDFAEVCAQHPSKFKAFAYLPLQAPDAAVTELRRTVEELGFVGAILGSHVNGIDWDDPTLFPVLEAASDLSVPVFVHPVRPRGRDFLRPFHLRNLIGNPLETTTAFARLALGGVMDRLPQLKIILAHGGGFAITGIGRFDHGYAVRKDTPSIAKEIPTEYVKRVYVDTVTHNYDTLRLVANRVGIAHVLLGSDYPADMGQLDPARWMSAAPNFSEAEKQAVMRENIEDLIGPWR